MKVRTSLTKRVLSMLLVLCLIIPCLPTLSLPVTAESVPLSGAVADPGTANNYLQMLGTSSDGNRYSGRVSFDKSVYTYGNEASLPLHSDFSGLAQDTIKIDSNFMVVGSAIGSTTSVTTTTSSDAALDVVLVLDNSQSMEGTRFTTATAAANELIKNILENDNNRVAVVSYALGSHVLLALDHYKTQDTYLTANSNGKLTSNAIVEKTNTSVTASNEGFQRGTNQQEGIYTGMTLLANATDITGRIPVVIILTDGVADTAVSVNWQEVASSNREHPKDNTITAGVALSTILTGAYMKALVEDNYNVAPTVYGIGVDLDTTSDAAVAMDPANAFNAQRSGIGGTAYSWYEEWMASADEVTKTESVSSNNGGNNRPSQGSQSTTATWYFNQLPDNSTVTKQDVMDNINYVDNYEAVGSTDLSDKFDSILVEINEKAFIPLVDKVVQGQIEVEAPLTYVDFIGDYMEVKEFKAVTLFGKIYSVSKSLEAPVVTDSVENGIITRTEVTTYIVESDTVTNEPLGVTFNVSDAVKITVKDTYTVVLNSAGVYEKVGISKQEVRATIPAAALPLIYDKVTNNQGVITYESNRGEVVPLRLYYTVDMIDEIVDANGNVITDLIDADYLAKNTNADGTVNFYSNAYGVMNPAAGETVLYGDAHAAATPSTDNRYYYHQNNYPIYISATNADGSAIDWDEDEYGVLYYQGDGVDQTLNNDYKTEYLYYSDVASLGATDQIYTMVAFYRPTSGGAGEAVGYLVYTEWQYLKDSLAYYDDVNKVYINGYSGGVYLTSETEGYGVSTTVVDSYIKDTGITADDIVCVLGNDTWRTSRLHNMKLNKTSNVTGTAEYVFVPTHNEDASHDGSLVAWLGNNGKLALTPQQGISITKTVTEAVAGAESEFEFTVTVSGTDFTPEFIDEAGNSFNSVPVVKEADKTTITLTLEANETVYITNLPTGAAYTVTETLSNYYSAAYTNAAGTVKANEISHVSVVNSPKAYGELVITKEVFHPFTGNLDNEFDFTVIISGVTQWEAQNKLSLPAGATAAYENGAVTVSGIAVKDDGSATITGIPAGAVYTVTELDEKGFTLDTDKTAGASGVIPANSSVTAQFVNNYAPVNSVDAKIAVSGTKTVQTNAGITETFNFKVQKLNEATNEYVDISGATASVEFTDVTIAGAIGQYSISLNETYTTVGTHYYRVVEVGGTTEGMTYDTTEGLFKVTVSDPGVIDGELVVEVEAVSDSSVSSTSDGFSVEVDFLNVYVVDSTHADIVIKKTLNNDTGVNIPLNIFEFELSSGSNVIRTVHTDALGNATIRLPIDSEGKLTYTLSEVDGGMKGMEYDKKVYTVTIVTENVNGALVSEVTVSDTTDNIALFTNKYALDNSGVESITVNGKKILENKTVTDGQFSFVISEANDLYTPVSGGWTSTVKNDKDGNFTIVLPEYTEIGTYRYVLTEVVPDSAVNNLLDGITYDTSVYHVTVVVTDNGDGKFASAVQITKLGVGDVNEITFTNTYNVTGTASLILEGDKTLTDRELLGSEFTFIVDVYKDGVKQPSHTTTNLSTGAIQFPEFTYDSSDIGVEYEYVITESIPDDAVNGKYKGVTYDTAEYRVTVKVNDDGKGGISLDITGDDAKELNFVNTYSAEKVSVSLSGNKTLNGRDMEDGEFEFVLKDESGDEIETVSNIGKEFNFKDITYTKAGVYKYTVSEVKGDKGGVIYDETVYTVTVTVSDDGNGVLTASTVIGGLGSLSFTNIYRTENAVIEIPGKKTLKNKTLEEGDFTFGIYRANVSGDVFTIVGDAMLTVTNKADGTFEFTNGVFTTPGTYYYVVKEINDGVAGIIYDKTQYNVTVVVTDNGEGSLVADVTVAGGQIEFENTYSPLKTSVTFKGTKVFNKTLSKGDFSFVLKDENGNELETVENNADGSFEFTAIEYQTAGEHKYTVSEVNDGKAGVSYDDTVYEITVTVADGGDGRLAASVTGGTSFTFTNSYSAGPVSVPLTGKKVLEGRTLEAGEFEFALYNSEGRLMQTVKNNANGEFRFNNITFTAAGNYTFIVTEILGTKGGVSYDNTAYTVRIAVTDNGDGTLSYNTSISGKGELVFTNLYRVEKTTETITGTKVLNGRELKAGEFSFQLKDENGEVIETVTNLADGSFAFSPITYTEAGVYKYTVNEVKGDLSGIKYDGQKFFVTVTVSDDGSGQLVTETSMTGGRIKFVNTYSAQEISVSFDGIKTLDGKTLADGQFAFALTDEDGNLLQTVNNDANGVFSFAPITYSAAGEYLYYVTEVNDGQSGIIYDESVFIITVNVVDDMSGKLTAEVSISGDGDIEFVNRYTVSPINVPLSATKILDGKELTQGEFVFYLKDENGTVLQTVSNSADGTISFNDLVFNKAGTYVYTVNELIGSVDGMTYDDTVYTVTVEVTDNGDGTLTAVKTVDGGEIVFNNIYDVSEPDESGSDESDSDESDSDESDSDESDSDESDSDESGSDESGSDESDSDESDSDESDSDESGSDESDSDESDSDESGSDESGSDESGSDESGSDESDSDESDSDESDSDESNSDESGSDESDSDETPELGDNTDFVLWASLLTISVIGLAVLHINRRRVSE